MASNKTRARREPTGGKSKMVAALLAFFLGALGVHQFYLGHGGRGVAMLLLTISFVGLIRYLTIATSPCPKNSSTPATTSTQSRLKWQDNFTVHGQFRSQVPNPCLSATALSRMTEY